MKKLILAFTIASASSLFADYANWFSATPATLSNCSLSGEDGSVVTNTTAETPYWEIDASAGGGAPMIAPEDGSLPYEFNAITEVKVTTAFDAAYDLDEDSIPECDGDAFGAIIVGTKTGDESVVSNFYICVQGNETREWVKVCDSALVPEDLATPMDVKIEVLYVLGSGCPKVRYSIKEHSGDSYTVLTDSSGKSLFDSLDKSQEDSLSGVQFVGCGKVYDVAATVRTTERFDGGDGTEAAPYLINSSVAFEELRALNESDQQNSGCHYVKLGFEDEEVVALENWVALGTSECPFVVNFDGAGKTVNVDEFNPETGFFGVVSNAKIANLTISASAVGGSGSIANAVVFATEAKDGVIFENCTVGEIEIEGTTSAVGFVLTANATDASTTSVTFTNCSVSANAVFKAEHKAAFVGTIAKGVVVAEGDNTTDGNNSYNAYITEASEGTAPTAFKFTRNVEESGLTIYREPTNDCGDDLDYYHVVVANEDSIVLTQLGMMRIEDQTSIYNGTVYKDVVGGTVIEESTTVSGYRIYTYPTEPEGPKVTISVFSEVGLSVVITNGGEEVASATWEKGAPVVWTATEGDELDITWTIAGERKLFADGSASSNYTYTVASDGYTLPVPDVKTETVYLVDNGDENEGCVQIAPDFIATLAAGVTDPEAIKEKLNNPGANGIPEWQNYAMGLSTVEGLATEDKKPEVKAVQDTETDKVTLNLAGLCPPPDSGASIKYVIDGTSGATPTAYGQSLTIDLPAFNNNSKVEIIKVKVIVEPAKQHAK